MFNPARAFSGFSVKDIAAAKEFYTNVLGCSVKDDVGGVRLTLPGGTEVWMYEKGNAHQPATYTMLNFIVANIDEAVEELSKHGVTFEHYENSNQDEKNIARGISQNMGPDIAWFRDPAGNILSVLQAQ